MRFSCSLAVALALLAVSCRSTKPAADVDSVIASCVPAGTQVLAGFDLTRIRSAPVYRQLPPFLTALAETYRDASGILLAYDGKDTLALDRGSFPAAPAGATLVNSHLAIYGPGTAVQAALAQRRRGVAGAPRLMSYAASAGRNKAICAVVPGDAPLALTGNAANFEPVKRHSEYIAIAAELDARVHLEIAVHAVTPAAAFHVEQTLRTALALAVATEKRGSEGAKLFAGVDIRRDDAIVRASVTSDGDSLAKLIAHFIR